MNELDLTRKILKGICGLSTKPS